VLRLTLAIMSSLEFYYTNIFPFTSATAISTAHIYRLLDKQVLSSAMSLWHDRQVESSYLFVVPPPAARPAPNVEVVPEEPPEP
jgi:hypothetical protein